jgi:hypothetical protein
VQRNGIGGWRPEVEEDDVLGGWLSPEFLEEDLEYGGR